MMDHCMIYQHYSEDHDRLDELFRQFQGRKSADRAGAAGLFRAMFDTLARLERNMHQHVHKENNVLFPRALALGGGT